MGPDRDRPLVDAGQRDGLQQADLRAGLGVLRDQRERLAGARQPELDRPVPGAGRLAVGEPEGAGTGPATSSAAGGAGGKRSSFGER